MEKLILKMSRAVTIWKGLIALRQSTDAFRLKSLQDIKDRVHLITVPGQNGVEKEDVVIGYQITAPNGDIYAVFVNADEKSSWI